MSSTKKQKLIKDYDHYRNSIRWEDTAKVAKFPKHADPKWSIKKLEKMWGDLFKLYARQASNVYGKYKT